MKYHYLVEIVTPTLVQKALNEQGKNGYKLAHIQPLNTIIGSTVQGFPRTEITYQLIFEKIEQDGTS